MDYKSPFELMQSALDDSSQSKIVKKRSTGNKDPAGSGKDAASSGSETGSASASSRADGKDPTVLEREIPGLENINALNANMKHEEEVQRHIEEGSLAPHEVAEYIMAHGSTGQKISMFQHLHKTVPEMDEKKVTHLMGILCDGMWGQAPEMQIAAPAALQLILPFLNDSQAFILFEGARTMLDVRTADVRQAWIPFVLDCIGSLSVAKVLSDAAPLAIKKSEHSEPQDQRILSANMIGRICRKLDASRVNSTVMQKAMAMCQDTNVGVRVAMCAQLGEVARAVGLENSKLKVTAELFELLVDEEKLVSRAAFSCLIDLIEFFDAPYRREHFYPIIRSYISNPPEEVLTLLIEELGRFLWKIKSDIPNNDDVVLFAGFFKQCAQKPDADLRRMCAFNLPAVVASLPVTIFHSQLFGVTKSLATDSHTPTRRCIAAGLHELVALLGDRAGYYLREPFLALLQDPVISVRQKFMENVTVLLSCFSSQMKGDERENFFALVVPALVSFEQQAQKDWRMVRLLLTAAEKFPVYFSGAVLFDKFAPLLIKHLKEGAMAIRDLCASLLVRFTKNFHNSNNVVEIFAKVTNEFGRSPSCFQRMNYIRVFSAACDSYSRRFIRDRMLDLVQELSKDTVSSIRVAVARTIPKLRRVVKHSSVDQARYDAYQSMCERLQMDDDDFVREATREGLDELDGLEREYARQTALKLVDAADDLEDRKREDEEGSVLELAKEHDKMERRTKLKELLKNEKDVVPSDLGSKRPMGKRSNAGGASSTPPATGAVATSTGVRSSGSSGSFGTPSSLQSAGYLRPQRTSNSSIPAPTKATPPGQLKR
jgi:serine/threonine-protein phosphatase 4 regulatory subunit 4